MMDTDDDFHTAMDAPPARPNWVRTDSASDSDGEPAPKPAPPSAPPSAPGAAPLCAPDDDTNFPCAWDDPRLFADSRFDHLHLGVIRYGWDHPSEVQGRTLPHLLSGRDVLAQAQSGTGKTGAFSLAMLSRVDTTRNECQAMLLCNTHELAQQSLGVLRTLGQSFEPPLRTMLMVGQEIDTREQIAQLRQPDQPHVIVGCPGRVHDMVVRRKQLSNVRLRIFVLDEVDVMLNNDSFLHQLENIFQCLTDAQTQVALFSATMDDHTRDCAGKMLGANYAHVHVNPGELTLRGIRQMVAYFAGNENLRYHFIVELFRHLPSGQCIIYTNTVSTVEFLVNQLQRDGHQVSGISSGIDHGTRKDILQRFRKGEIRVLVSSDLTARGIDVQQVNVVINFDIPTNVATYLHRIGRSGRYGRKGCAINLCAGPRAERCLRDIVNYYRLEDTLETISEPTDLARLLDSGR